MNTFAFFLRHDSQATRVTCQGMPSTADVRGRHHSMFVAKDIRSHPRKSNAVEFGPIRRALFFPLDS